MTFVGFIASADKIVALADGRVRYLDDSRPVNDAKKIYRLDDQTVALAHGELTEGIASALENVHKDVESNGLKGVEPISSYLATQVRGLKWKPTGTDVMALLVVGYINGLPQFYRVFNATGLQPISVPFFTGGEMAAHTIDRIDRELGTHNHLQITEAPAERILIDTLIEVENTMPEAVGGQERMWHISPQGIEVMNADYTRRLRSRSNS